MYILKQYEEGVTAKPLSDRKLAAGLEFKFNKAVILRAEAKTQLESLRGAVSPNPGRTLIHRPAKPGNQLLTNDTLLLPPERVEQRMRHPERR